MRISRLLVFIVPLMSAAAVAIGCGDDDPPAGPGPADGGPPDGSLTDNSQPPNPDGGDGASQAVPLRGPLTFSSLTSHACALSDGGTVLCWGRNTNNQTGVGAGERVETPSVVPALTDAVEVSAGGQLSCALRATKGVVCWGGNAFGQLGQADAAAPEFSARPLDVVGLADVRGVAAGDAFACAVRADKTVACWGSNDKKQLGVDGVETSDTPVAVPGIANVEVLASGPTWSCVVESDRTVSCWGRGEAPNPIEGVTKASSVAVGLEHACAVLEDRTVVCWGPGSIPANTITDAVAVRAGYNHTCVLRATGAVSCWGKNENGALGSGSTEAESLVPVDVSGVSDGVDVTTGLSFGCVRRSGAQKVSCWGANDFGQLGTASDAGSSSTPVGIVGF